MEIEDLENLNSVEMSNQRLLRVEASEIGNLQMVIANLLQLNQTLPFTESSKFLHRELNLSTPFDSFYESLTLILQRKIVINALRYALFAFLRPAVVLLVLLLELLAVAVLFRLTCTRKGINSGAEASTMFYLLLHVAAIVVENALFNGLELLSYAFGVEHPATAFKMLCNLWWLGFKVVHAFPLWILFPAAFRAGAHCPFDSTDILYII